MANEKLPPEVIGPSSLKKWARTLKAERTEKEMEIDFNNLLFDAIDLLGRMKLGELQRFVDWFRENYNSDNLPWNYL